MITCSVRRLERKEKLTALANDAEIKQHWFRAAILWRKLGDIPSAEFCESLLQYLAEHDLQQLSLASNAWQER